MDKLKGCLPNLSIDPSSEHSIVEDPVFQTFKTAILSEKEDESWYRLVYGQEYPDPTLLLNGDQFACAIAKQEPGQYIDYEQVRNDLYKAESYMQGGPEMKALTFKLYDELVINHVRYVHAATCAMGFEMYSRLIDRFYGKTGDLQFECLLSSNLPIESSISSNWPSYEYVKHHNTCNLNFWRSWQNTYANSIVVLKNSPDLRLFFAQLHTALEASATTSCRMKVQSKRNTINSHTQNLHRVTSPLLNQRRCAVEKHKLATQMVRNAKHQELKLNNLHNIHQLGEQSRQRLTDGVVQALSDIQEEWKDKMFEEQCLGDYVGETVEGEDNVSEKVEWQHASASLTPNGRDEPFDGIILANGLVNLAAGASNYF